MRAYLPLVPEDYGNSSATATPLNITTVDPSSGLVTAKASGVVSSATGDWFLFQAAAGTATLSAAVVAPWISTNRANLDMQLAVYDAAGTAVATINPPGADAISGLGVPPTSVVLPVNGTFIVAVTGVGAGDPLITGYSSYGCRGQFELSVVYAPCTGDCNSTIPIVPPSPSPSPEPVPSPSPSPSPAPQALRVKLDLSKNPGSPVASCKAWVTITDASSTKIAGARVAGTWTTTPWASNTVSYTSTATTSATSNPVTFNSVSAVVGRYIFVFNVTKLEVPAGYYFDSANSVMTKQLAI